MKKSTDNQNQGVAPRTSALLTAIAVACAMGIGVTGTLLWVQSRAAQSSAPPTAAPVVAPVVNSPLPDVPVPQTASHEPPASLTAGLTAPQAALALGNWDYDHEKWDLAVQNYRGAIAGGIDNPNVRTDLGNALRFSNQPQEALKQYQIAQKQDPSHEQSLFNQGALYASSLQNPKKGIAVWQAYLKRFPKGQTVDAARSLIAQAQKAS